MIRKNSYLLLLLLACLLWLPPPVTAGAAEARRTGVEEFSPSSGGNGTGTTMRLRLPPASARAAPVIPKSLTELRAAAGNDYMVMQRGNYLVASDLDQVEYEYLVDGVLDYCSAALINVFFDKGPVTAKTVNIFVFRDYESYETGLRRFVDMNPITPYGHYGHTQKYIVINYETGPGTMVHELTHALMSEDFPDAPIWLAEGMASLYEHCRAEGDVLKGDDNWRLPELKHALETNAMTPLADLLVMSPPEFLDNRMSLNYAQVRYFCKYMEELGVLSTVYKNFRDGYNKDPTGEMFISKAFGKPLGVVEAAWKRWITFQYWQD